MLEEILISQLEFLPLFHLSSWETYTLLQKEKSRQIGTINCRRYLLYPKILKTELYKFHVSEALFLIYLHQECFKPNI